GPPVSAALLALTAVQFRAGQSGLPLSPPPLPYTTLFRSNPVSQSGVVVTATLSPAGATPGNATATTGSNGSTAFSGLTLTGTVGSYTLNFGATGLTPATAAITLSAGAAAVIAANSPTTQSAPARR